MNEPTPIQRKPACSCSCPKCANSTERARLLEALRRNTVAVDRLVEKIIALDEKEERAA